MTTILDGTLEKKGLMTWPMGMALKELFGFYDFTNEKGDRMTGFSKGQGTLWNHQEVTEGMTGWTPGGEGVSQKLTPQTPESALPLVLSASKAWQRRQKKGADIGSLVHDAIEHYVKHEPFSISLEQYRLGQGDMTPEEEYEWLKTAEADVEQANLAFSKFVEWWEAASPTLLGAEDLIYSKKYDFCGTFDGLIELDGVKILCDWKTSNASVSAGAPQGVYYSHFIQSAMYALAWEEMGNGLVDDLAIISCRKDGGFNFIKASDVNLSVEDAVDWAKAVLTAHKHMNNTKTKLISLGKGA